MATGDAPEGEIQFHFFKAITTKKKSYFCDFHKVYLESGNFSYRVVLQSLHADDIVTDMHLKDNTWCLAEPHDEIPAELEWLLVTAILENQ